MLGLAVLGNYLSQVSGDPVERHLGLFYKERPNDNNNNNNNK